MIYCDPYPYNGVDKCGSISMAAEVIQAAEDVEPDITERLGLAAFVVKDADGRVCFKSGVEINKVRPHISRLWEAMPKEARTRFHRIRFQRGAIYVVQVAQNMRNDDVISQEMWTAVWDFLDKVITHGIRDEDRDAHEETHA